MDQKSHEAHQNLFGSIYSEQAITNSTESTAGERYAMKEKLDLFKTLTNIDLFSADMETIGRWLNQNCPTDKGLALKIFQTLTDIDIRLHRQLEAYKNSGGVPTAELRDILTQQKEKTSRLLNSLETWL